MFINMLSSILNFFKSIIEAIQNSRMERAKRIAEDYKNKYGYKSEN